jgi:hypothetical protein
MSARASAVVSTLVASDEVPRFHAARPSATRQGAAPDKAATAEEAQHRRADCPKRPKEMLSLPNESSRIRQVSSHPRADGASKGVERK